MISNPSRIDAKRGDHFLEPDFLSGIISGLPSLVQNPGTTYKNGLLAHASTAT